MMKMSIFAVFMALCTMTCPAFNTQNEAQEKLSKAVDYFQGGKYHEALLMFEKIEKEYQLNPRFEAYIGVCQFYDRDFENAAKTLDKVMPQLESFAPHEKAVYLYCDAESHFQLKNFSESIILFEKQLKLCYNDEKGDALLRIGICHWKLGDIPAAQKYLKSAKEHYMKFNETDKIEHMECEISSLCNK